MSVLAAAALLAAQAPLAPAPPRQWPTVAGWRVFEVSDGCGIHRTSPARGVVSAGLLLSRSGTVLFALATPANRPPRAAGEVSLAYEFDRDPFPAVDSFHGTLRSGVYSARVPPELAERFERSFAQASTLRVSGAGRPIAAISLRGTAAALEVARRCLGAVDDDRAAGIYREPPAGSVPAEFDFPPAPMVVLPEPLPPPPPPPPAEGPRRAQIRSGYISSDDYPAAAIRAGEEGTVAIRLTVEPDGRVSSCAVSASSGSAVLDARSCLLARSRFRFWSALDENHRPIRDTVTRRIRWDLPDEPEPAPAPPPR